MQVQNSIIMPRVYYSLRSSVPTTRTRSRARGRLNLLCKGLKRRRARQNIRKLSLVKNGKLTVEGKVAADTGDREYDQLVNSFGKYIHLSQGRPAAVRARIALKCSSDPRCSTLTSSKVTPAPTKSHATDSTSYGDTNPSTSSTSSTSTAQLPRGTNATACNVIGNTNKTRRSMTTTGTNDSPDPEPLAVTTTETKAVNPKDEAQTKQTSTKKRVELQIAIK
jgi:hypothetical protein